MPSVEVGCSSSTALSTIVLLLSIAQGAAIPCLSRMREHAPSLCSEFEFLPLWISFTGFKSFSLTSVELQMLTNSCVKLQTVHNIPLTINKEGEAFGLCCHTVKLPWKPTSACLCVFPLELLLFFLFATGFSLVMSYKLRVPVKQKMRPYVPNLCSLFEVDGNIQKESIRNKNNLSSQCYMLQE